MKQIDKNEGRMEEERENAGLRRKEGPKVGLLKKGTKERWKKE